MPDTQIITAVYNMPCFIIENDNVTGYKYHLTHL